MLCLNVRVNAASNRNLRLNLYRINDLVSLSIVCLILTYTLFSTCIYIISGCNKMWKLYTAFYKVKIVTRIIKSILRQYSTKVAGDHLTHIGLILRVAVIVFQAPLMVDQLVMPFSFYDLPQQLFPLATMLCFRQVPFQQSLPCPRYLLLKLMRWVLLVM